MTADIFVKFDSVKGESQDNVYKDAIDVLSWGWSLSQSGNTHTGGGGGAGKVSVQDLSFVKQIDKATPVLGQMCCDGTHFKEASLVMRKAGKEALEYYRVTMKKGLISSISKGASKGEDMPTEQVTLNFEEYKEEYTPQKEDGTGDAAVESAWNMAQNKAP
ncbi:MAG: type VI secretion system tube protein Hcp [Gammaproteobacteria bacterium]|nr:type VI secretion system tube protein Hcp [Gammaproteobacteria bacterium]MDH3465100.1 type VI secretion system tube protein Hcp [Gammaproteobacteria bacterium]